MYATESYIHSQTPSQKKTPRFSSNQPFPEEPSAFSISRPRGLLRLFALIKFVADIRRLLSIALKLVTILDLDQNLLVPISATSCGRLLVTAGAGGDEVRTHVDE